MVNDGKPVDLAAKIAEIRAKKAQASPPPVPQPQWKQDDLLPDLGGNLSDADKELDAFVERIDIIDAYVKWCGKMTPDATGKRDGIKISCPDPGHRDSNPSAWINIDKQTYFCGGCEVGGDKHDIAALNFGFPVPGYKEGELFGKLRLQMAESFGFRVKEVPGGKVTWIEPEEPAKEAPNQERIQEEYEKSVQKDTNTVVPLRPELEDDEEDLVVYPTINWRNLVPEDTFLYEYMKATSNDDSPEEYHFWHGMVALGLVVGRKVTLDDTRPVYGNLLMCILGATGVGKSRSRGWLSEVLKQVAPYKEDGTQTTGVKQVPVPSSGEYLVHTFAYEGKDPANNKTSLGMQPVTGIVDFDEMSALLSRANRQGSTLKPTIMAFGDASNEVKIGGLQRGDFIAKEPFCTITASTQPKALRTLLSRDDAGSGFINRWVFVGGKTKEAEAIGGTRSSIRVDLSTACEELKKVRGWGALERSIEMEDDAFERYVKIFRDKLAPMKEKDPTDLLKRIDLIFKKIMLLLTINERKTKVPLHVVNAANDLIDYVVECFGITNSNIGVTMMQDVMNDIQKQIEKYSAKKGHGMTASELSKYLRRKNYGLEQIKKALDVMTALDIIEMDKKQQGPGRPTIRYQVVS